MASFTMRQAAIGISLSFCAAFLAGCGGGGDDPTPAPTSPPTNAPAAPTNPPTKAPTATPTNAPTMPPTSAGMKAACSWTTGDTTELMEADCGENTDDKLKVNSVSFVRPPKEALSEGSVCRTPIDASEPEGAIEGFLKANCGDEWKDLDGTEVTEDHNANVQVGRCIKNEKNETAGTESDHTFQLTCDTKARTKEEYRITKNPSTAPCGEGVDCAACITNFKNGQETEHPEACKKDEAFGANFAAALKTVEEIV